MPSGEAKVSPFDRGFLFAQAAYEVTAVYNGELIDFEPHMQRLARTLAGIETEMPDIDLLNVHQEIMARNALKEGLVYLQVTAGDQGPRDYYGPETLIPSVFMFTTHKRLISDVARDGLTAVTYEDTRWSRRDFKTTQLVTQSLAYRAARRAGATTAILHEHGIVTEAASANLWIVTSDGKLITRGLSNALLPGVTRARVLAVLNNIGIEERAFSLDELRRAKEAFTSSTGAVIAPLTKLDGEPIGAGIPGPITRKVQAAYYHHIGADLSAIDWL